MVLLVALAAVVVLAILQTRPEGGISAVELAEGAEEALEAEAGARPEVSCPEGLDAEVGARTRCTLTAGGDPEELGVEVTVTSVDGDEFTVDVTVEEGPVE